MQTNYILWICCSQCTLQQKAEKKEWVSLPGKCQIVIFSLCCNNLNLMCFYTFNNITKSSWANNHISVELVSNVSETVNKMLGINSILMWLITQKDFTAFHHGESFKSYVYTGLFCCFLFELLLPNVLYIYVFKYLLDAVLFWNSNFCRLIFWQICGLLCLKCCY